MKRLFLTSVLSCFALCVAGQVVKDYNPAIQRTTAMQYFKPDEERYFAGDCMPYYHNGTFYLYWLLDEGHHSGLEGLGGHQWALSTSVDLVNWKHYPVAVGIDEEWEKSICTGSVIEHEGKFYAFYSTRIKDADGQVHEQLSYAVSADGGITYSKQQPNPFYLAPEECVSRDFRDPKAFRDEQGRFHLFVSGYMKNPPLSGFGGYLVHLVSDDLKNWSEAEPAISGQTSVPECSDYFRWNDWYYLVYSTHSETYYLKSPGPFGPWEYPETQAMKEAWANVWKTAPFKDNRRIAVAFLPGKRNGRDNEGEVFGGNILFRELTQAPDGTLSTKFLPEVMPRMSSVAWTGISVDSDRGESLPPAREFSLDGSKGISTAVMNGLPENYKITMTLTPEGNYDEMGLFVRATDTGKKGYKIELNANKQLALIHNTTIEGVRNLRGPVTLEMMVVGDFIDLCINGQRCIVNRLTEQKGDRLFFFIKNGRMKVSDIRIEKNEETFTYK